MTQIIVIGAGPAGMMAAGTAAKLGARVTLIEKNNFLGKKLAITGKGRCNLTTTLPIEEIINNFPGNSYFLYGPLYNFTNQDTIEFFSSLGLSVKEERGSRVFPATDRAKDVIKALEKYLQRHQVSIKTSVEVDKMLTNNKGETAGVLLADGRELPADKVILATGGGSYPATGSTGDGYRIAEELGHTIIPPKPALVPLEVTESYVTDLAGLSLKNVTASLVGHAGNIISEEFGEMLFTHFGVSGPIILTLSRIAAEELNKHRQVTLAVDLKPALTREKLEDRILRDFTKYSNKDFINSLTDLLPKALIPIIVTNSGIDPRKKVNQITKKERQNLINALKSFNLTITNTRPLEESIVTAGGVSVKEVSPSTMESKLITGLYFCGEILDYDGNTGGFNLQGAFSTGYVAGESASYL